MKAREDTVQNDVVLATRACGVLATALREALLEARQIAAREVAFLPAGAVDELDHLLEQFERHRIRVALFGEVKAGKSTLLNAIAGKILSPVAFDPLTSVPVRVTYGNETQWHVDGRVLTDLIELEQWMRSAPFAATEVVVTTPLDLLALGGQVDLLDTPGLGGRDEHFDQITQETIRALDAAVLVVRYPALFTRFTHQLVERLARQVSKLFVVWNLDPTSRDLTEVDRQRYARALAENVGMPHELYLVDARTALEQPGNSSAQQASGMTTFAEALRRFVSSTGREVAALRETAKAGVQWLLSIMEPLRQRYAEVTTRVQEARNQLSAVQAAGDQELAEARARQREFESALDRFSRETQSRAQHRASQLRRELHAARRVWMRTGHLLRLERAVAAAVSKYANDLASLAKMGRDELVTLAATFGTDVSIAVRPRREPSLGRLAPEDRNVRANSGSLRWLRRAVWAQWYLPGLAQFEKTAIDTDVAQFEQWLGDVVAATVQASRATTGERLRRIQEKTDQRLQEVRYETQLELYEDEARQLERGLPLVESKVERIQELARQAQLLLKPHVADLPSGS